MTEEQMTVEGAKPQIETQLRELEQAKHDADEQVDSSLATWEAAQTRQRAVIRLHQSANSRLKSLSADVREMDQQAMLAIVEDGNADFARLAGADAALREISNINRFLDQLAKLITDAGRAVVETEAEYEDRLADQAESLVALRTFKLNVMAAPMVGAEGSIELSGGATGELRRIAALHRMAAQGLREKK
jgi:hypothetical protein